MKLADIVKVIANELGTSDLKEINKLLKDEPAVRFRITGKSLKNLGFTGQIKSLSEEGIKAYMTNKVSLIRLHEIEAFEKRPRSEWYVKPVQEKPIAGSAPAKVSQKASVKKTKIPAKPIRDDIEDGEDFDDDENFDDDEKIVEKVTRNKGSKFIPSPKKK